MVDNTSPEITLNGDEEIYLERGDEYVELGATVTDNLDSEIEKSLVIDSSQVDVNKVASYDVRYYAQDRAGNNAVAVRTVRVLIPSEYTVELRANGGIVDAPLTLYVHGTGAELPIPRKVGYIFGGWYDNAEFQGDAILSISKKEAGNKVYYAKWLECDHSSRSERIILEPTCMAEGEKQLSCSVCQKIWNETIKMLQHVETEDPAIEATCLVSGKTRGLYCAMCNTVFLAPKEIFPLGHDWSDWSSLTGANCMEERTEKRFCQRCHAEEEKIIPAIGYHMIVSDSAIKATCTEAGKTEGSHCSECSIILLKQSEVPALGHDWGEWVTITEPTETKKGHAERYCKNDSNHKETKEIAPTGSTKPPAGGGGGSGGGGLVVSPQPEPVQTEPEIKKEEIEVPFTDIRNHWAKEQIEYGYRCRWFSGISENSFAPDHSITRAEFVTMLGHFAKADIEQYQKTSFADVKSADWFSQYIEWAYAKGYVTGKGQLKFDPDGFLTREEAAVILCKFTQNGAPTGKAADFADGDAISPWAKSSVDAVSAARFMKGDQNGRFCPQNRITRAEIAAIFKNLNDNNEL